MMCPECDEDLIDFPETCKHCGSALDHSADYDADHYVPECVATPMSGQDMLDALSESIVPFCYGNERWYIALKRALRRSQ